MEVLTQQQTNVFNNNKGELDSLYYHLGLETNFVEEIGDDDYVLEALKQRLENELRAAKTRLSVGEVLLPNNLTEKIARDILMKSKSELCGLRGCTLFVGFEGAEVCKQLSTIKFDSTTPSTYELILTLKQATGWNTFLPQFLKKISRSGGTIMISPDYTLEEKKLYSFFSD